MKDKREYVASYPEIGGHYREIMGRNFPAMTAVEVSDLVEDRAKVEIEVTCGDPAGRRLGGRRRVSPGRAGDRCASGSRWLRRSGRPCAPIWSSDFHHLVDDVQAHAAEEALLGGDGGGFQGLELFHQLGLAHFQVEPGR